MEDYHGEQSNPGSAGKNGHKNGSACVCVHLKIFLAYFSYYFTLQSTAANAPVN